MSAAPAAPRESRPLDPRLVDAGRLLGGLLFASGCVVLLARKAVQDEWAEFPRLLTVLIPCAILYALGIGLLDRALGRAGAAGRPLFPDRAAGTDQPTVARGAARVGGLVAEPWRSVIVVVGILLVPLVLFQFIQTIKGSPGAELNIAWVFLVTAVLAGFAALGRDVSYAALLAGIALIISWLAVWGKILEDADGTTVRWLLVIIGALLAAAAVALERVGPERTPGPGGIFGADQHAPDLMTAGGVALVSAGIVGFAGASGLGEDLGETTSGVADTAGVQQQLEWDIFLLVLSLTLIVYGARAARRGTVYVGAAGLIAFILSAGAEISTRLDGEDPKGEVFGWPLLLIVLGLAALAVGFLPFGRGGRPAAAGPYGPPPTPGTGYPAGPPQQQPPAPQPPTQPGQYPPPQQPGQYPPPQQPPPPGQQPGQYPPPQQPPPGQYPPPG